MSYHGVGGLFPKGGAFAGFGSTEKQLALAKAKALATAALKSKTLAQCAVAASNVVGADVMPALQHGDPDVTAWFKAFCAAFQAGTQTPPPPPAVITAVKVVAGAPPTKVGSSMSTGKKLALAGGALLGLVGVGVVVARSGKKSAAA